jgi:stage III sporulation protein SpoIIIAA
MAVPSREVQHKILMEAYSNHGPKVIIIDELGTPLEVKAARAVAQRGKFNTTILTLHHEITLTLLNNADMLSLNDSTKSCVSINQSILTMCVKCNAINRCIISSNGTWSKFTINNQQS